MIEKMLCKIKFNIEIDKNKEYIGLGGYKITSNGESYYFDFYQFIGNIDKEDKTILICEMNELDYVQDEDFEEINKDEKYFRNIESIDEFVICVNSDSLLEAIEIMDLKFITDTNEEIIISDEILKMAEINMVE
jgi:N-glycosylase/DNA lyase